MKDFFQLRLKKHQKHMMRYIKYVLNDHFVLVLTFLLGGIGYYYSAWVKSLPADFFWGKILILLIWLATLHFGQFVSLAKTADQVFLLPKEKQLRGYLSAAFSYSCIFPFVFLLLVTAFTMPLAVVSTEHGFISFIFYLFILWSLKISHLEIDRLGIFQDMKKARQNAYLLWFIISLTTLAVSLWLFPWLGLLLSFSQVVLFYKLCWQTMNVPLDWQMMIRKEERRLNRLYRFVNLFTDVPEITASVKRRSYLDFLLSRISFEQKNTYLYLFARRFLRGSEYSGLYLRLILVGTLLLFFTRDYLLALIIGIVFIYLIGFQLLPLYQQFQYVVLAQLYPIKKSQKQNNIKKLLACLLAVTAFIFSLTTLWSLTSWLDRIAVCLVWFLVVILFIQFYLPKRLKKMAS